MDLETAYKIIESCKGFDDKTSSTGEAWSCVKKLNDDLLQVIQSALQTAEFENHPWRPWHDQARQAIKKARTG